MVHADERDVVSKGKGFGKGNAHQKTTHEARATRNSDTIDMLPRVRAELCLGKKTVEQGADEAGVFAGGQFGHDAAEQGVYVGLTGDDGGFYAAVIDKCKGGFIAGAFYSQNQHR
jgi:hypothetical protein